MTGYTIRFHNPSDHPGLRAIYGGDEFTRPALLLEYPRMADCQRLDKGDRE